jgi:hypothetical protein
MSKKQTAVAAETFEPPAPTGAELAPPLPDVLNEPVPGAPDAGQSASLGYTDTPTPAELAAAYPGVLNPATGRVWYKPDGTVKPQAEVVENPGPEGMPPVTADDAPFSTHDIPAGWNRHPTQVEVDYLNALYPTEGYVPPPPDFTGTFRGFSQQSPTVAYADLEDSDALQPGYYVTLMALTGLPEGIAAIDGLTVTVLAVESPTITLDLDLSGVDTQGLSADYVWEAPV